MEEGEGDVIPANFLLGEIIKCPFCCAMLQPPVHKLTLHFELHGVISRKARMRRQVRDLLCECGFLTLSVGEMEEHLLIIARTGQLYHHFATARLVNGVPPADKAMAELGMEFTAENAEIAERARSIRASTRSLVSPPC